MDIPLKSPLVHGDVILASKVPATLFRFKSTPKLRSTFELGVEKAILIMLLFASCKYRREQCQLFLPTCSYKFKTR